ncbi:MAG: hypothetical protein MJ233_03625 [Mycoplasmoidaceae bacterium]|nr:hypothetical protein [Mycoplasmoidaceae bacterium]
MTKLLKPTPAYDTGKRIISFSNGYIPNNITSFIYGDITFTRTDDITELDCDVYKYYVSPESYGYEFGVFFCTTRESIAIPKIQITFECELDSTIETTVELNKTT